VKKITRRGLLRAGSVGAASVVGGGVLGRLASAKDRPATPTKGHSMSHVMGTVGRVDHQRNGFDPSRILYDFDYGTVSKLPNGQTLRTYLVAAGNQRIEIAPDVFFDAWTYNGRAPGPTIRCTEGDRVRIEFVNGGTHPHTMHFHGLHSAAMDGVPGVGAGNIEPGGRTVYEFDAYPFGCHLYHCHSVPLKRHIHKGLYGAFIIDPDPARHPDEAEAAHRRSRAGAKAAGIREMVMVMNAFDTNFDSENDVYAVNSIAFGYQAAPITIGTDEDVRLYLINITEFDPINSFHLHGNFFDYFDTGTSLKPTVHTDTIMQCQAQRGILEFSFRGYAPGMHMFHAHQTEFVELGWMGFFDVVKGRP
jgi:FtsP/CotA-like multicopper oxidase with cupredoxin domain